MFSRSDNEGHEAPSGMITDENPWSDDTAHPLLYALTGSVGWIRELVKGFGKKGEGGRGKGAK